MDHQIRTAFADRNDLQKQILDFVARNPGSQTLFDEISRYVSTIKAPAGHSGLPLHHREPLAKKRKLDTSADDATTWTEIESYIDVSFSIPQRKKLKLDISQSYTQGFRIKNAQGDIETAVSWSRVSDVFCLPVPEKSQSQYNFCVLLHASEGPSEQILWTVPESAPKPGTVDPPSALSPGETYRSHMLSRIDTALKEYQHTVVVPSEKEFASQIVQAHRKTEKAYHVKAFRGAKDGFLFFLSNGIFWGFKKPLEFFSFSAIDSVSYTSVLQRTFNLVISSRSSLTAQPEEMEFSMVDQEDFAGIDAYVKKHQLQDASMAEQRRAKRENVNGATATGDPNEDRDEKEGELQKAAREAKELEDDEDDEEDDENFDPGSEGESEGEGTSSEDDEPTVDGGTAL